MRHRKRFGFEFKYYESNFVVIGFGLFVIIFFSGFSIASILFRGADVVETLTYAPIMFILGMFIILLGGWNLVRDYLEEFEIKNGKIIRYIHYKNFEKEISDTAGFMNIPDDFICVITYEYSKYPPRTSFEISSKGIFRENIFSLTVLKDIDLKTALEKIHYFLGGDAFDLSSFSTVKITPYIGNRMEILFKEKYFYQFFCTQEAVDELLKDRKCLVIIPESLWGKVQINSDKARIYIDKGY